MDSANALAPGTIIHGRELTYQIVKVLGQGSFGITYLAAVKTGGSVEALVAVKEFFMSEINGRDNSAVTASSRDGLFGKYKRKFINEANGLSKLRHPNIVRVTELFEANNTVYYVMEFVEGGTLDDYIKQHGRLSEHDTMRIAGQILEALDYMHGKNVLHLDLKPSNIMMSHGEPVLIDFGLSKQYDDDGSPETSTTIGAGTPGYAPIEQLNYNGSTAGRLPVTMDFYALGATMFKMLTGKRPPEATELFNMGFPAQELTAAGVTPGTIALIQDLMQPSWRLRPQTDAAVRALMSSSDVLDEHTMIGGLGDSPTPPLPPKPPVPPTPAAPVKKKSNGCLISSIIAVTIILVITILAFAFGNNSEPDPEPVPFVTTDSAAVEDTVAVDSAVVETEKPVITYRVKKSADFGDENAKLIATVNGNSVVVGSISYLMGSDNFVNLDIFAQKDFDGDGIMDVLLSDANIGSAGGCNYVFVTYTGNNTFKKSKVIDSWYEPALNMVNGRLVLEFKGEDLGQEVVKKRYALINGEAVAQSVPKAKAITASAIKTVNLDNYNTDDSFYLDLDGDGIDETIRVKGSYHAGKDFEFYIDGIQYEFSISSNWGAGNLSLLSTKTNGMHDLMLNHDGRTIYKWNGSTYE